jgi:hypothetical protein
MKLFLFGSEKDEENERRLAQWRNIFNQFPWLWAVKPYWRPGFDDLEVHNATSESFQQLLRSTNDEHLVWIHRQFREAVAVEEVRFQPGTKVAQRLAEALRWNAGSEFLHIVGASPLHSDGSKIFVIFRAKGGHDEFENLIVAASLGGRS